MAHPAAGETLLDDLAACASVIRGQGLPEPRHYCYPSGDYDHNAHAALQEIGVKSATTCLPGLIDTATGRDVSYLPRFLDGERIHALEEGRDERLFGLPQAVGRARLIASRCCRQCPAPRTAPEMGDERGAE